MILTSKIQKEIKQIKEELNFTTIFEWQTQLEISCKKTLESFMCWSYGIDWDKEAIGIVKYETLKDTMYFDDRSNTWLDK